MAVKQLDREKVLQERDCPLRQCEMASRPALFSTPGLAWVKIAFGRSTAYCSVMSKADILDELPKLGLEERRQIFERLCELEERDLLNGVEPTAEEKALLDRELEDYHKNPEAGSAWEKVEERLLKQRAR